MFYWKAIAGVAFSQHQEASVDTTNHSKTSIEMGTDKEGKTYHSSDSIDIKKMRKRFRERECKTLVDGLEL